MISASTLPALTTSPTRFPNIDLANGEICEIEPFGGVGFVFADDPKRLLPPIVTYDRH